MSFVSHGLSRLAWLRPTIDYGRRRQAREMQTPDAATLRDLAIDRSELASYLAEARAEAQLTRRRVALVNGTRGGS